MKYVRRAPCAVPARTLYLYLYLCLCLCLCVGPACVRGLVSLVSPCALCAYRIHSTIATSTATTQNRLRRLPSRPRDLPRTRPVEPTFPRPPCSAVALSSTIPSAPTRWGRYHKERLATSCPPVHWRATLGRDSGPRRIRGSCAVIVRLGALGLSATTLQKLLWRSSEVLREASDTIVPDIADLWMRTDGLPLDILAPYR